MRILEELWDGNIEPIEYDTFPCAEYKEALQRISRNEENLQSTMTDAQKELFSRYADKFLRINFPRDGSTEPDGGKDSFYRPPGCKVRIPDGKSTDFQSV